MGLPTPLNIPSTIPACYLQDGNIFRLSRKISFQFFLKLVINRSERENVFLKIKVEASLVAQWLRICLPMQGTRVRVLIPEDPTCRGAAGPVHHNY